jgi:hypothetical protein
MFWIAAPDLGPKSGMARYSDACIAPFATGMVARTLGISRLFKRSQSRRVGVLIDKNRGVCLRFNSQESKSPYSVTKI